MCIAGHNITKVTIKAKEKRYCMSVVRPVLRMLCTAENFYGKLDK